MAEEFYFQWQNKFLRETIYPRHHPPVAATITTITIALTICMPFTIPFCTRNPHTNQDQRLGIDRETTSASKQNGAKTIPAPLSAYHLDINQGLVPPRSLWFFGSIRPIWSFRPLRFFHSFRSIHSLGSLHPITLVLSLESEPFMRHLSFADFAGSVKIRFSHLGPHLVADVTHFADHRTQFKPQIFRDRAPGCPCVEYKTILQALPQAAPELPAPAPLPASRA